MIGIFDSGSGGLTVLRALRARAPQADVVYFGDLANAPYGNKSREELADLTAEGIRTLLALGATEIVSACNSVSVSLVLSMLDTLGVPRDKMIEMVAPTTQSFKGTDARVLLLATRATVQSGAYQSAFRFQGKDAHAHALPLLVSLIEDDAPSEEVEKYIASSLADVDLAVYSHVLLCCTHYPLVWNCFENTLRRAGSDALLVDPAEAVAARAMTVFDTAGEGKSAAYLSAPSEVFACRLDAIMGGRPYTLTMLE